MAEPSPGEFLRAVVDPLRLQVLGLASIGIVSVSEVSERCGVPEKNVRHAQGRLASTGLIDAEGGMRRDGVRAVDERSMIRADGVYRRARGRHVAGDNLCG